VFFELFHLKDVMGVVFDHLLNFKKFKIMKVLKSICRTLLIGAALTFLGNLILTVGSSVGVEGKLTNTKSIW
jgi:hypothetical protein